MSNAMMNDAAGKRYTYDDYAKWDDDARYELIDGVPRAMAAPSDGHQAIVVEMCRQLANFLVGKPCKLRVAPYDVRLNPKTRNPRTKRRDDIVVQPDLLVVCDPSMLKNGKNCEGAPDLIIEVLSPSNQRHDLLIKMRLYQQAGVREFWTVDPGNQLAHVHILRDGAYTVTAYDRTDAVPVLALPGCEVDLRGVFGIEGTVEAAEAEQQ